MDLKNYQEDLVLYVADRVLRDRPDVRPNQVMLHDVAALALNRLPPRYVQSERGFTRFAAEQWVENGNAEGLAGLMEVLLLVNRGVDVVKGRRRGQPLAAAGAASAIVRRGQQGRVQAWQSPFSAHFRVSTTMAHRFPTRAPSFGLASWAST